ncbi:hypothetical protein TorRG33x02_259330 [Trema orientale]|uniref:Retrovirus-related Pol polyprotein from transposon TNT 1-94-like beta-barrel domain-containing protein n=1 Tax=Trema orientale TaxID=63057 RepID=A0A2P5D870_TREOI|nr:hypothetical protein TorRG33x02_259330 [Trema orientale]
MVDLQNSHSTHATYKKSFPNNGGSSPSQFNQCGGGSFRGRGNGRSSGKGGRGSGRGNRPVCQVYGKAGHVAIKYYHHFDISFQSPDISSHGTSQGNSPHQAYLALPTTVVDSAWYLDSGATNHVTADLNNLYVKSDYKGKEKFLVENGFKLSISHIGSNTFNTLNQSSSLLLKNILHVPCISKNLLSISQFTKDNNVLIEFYSDCCLIKDKSTKKILPQGTLLSLILLSTAHHQC